MRMVGGFFRFDPVNASLLVGLLPSVVHVKAQHGGAQRLAWIATAIGDEATAERPGREPILVRLAEILLIEALRWRPAQASPQVSGLLAGLADPRLGKALRRLHGDVAHPWTVADLARTASMSRAAFAAAFTRMLGLPPIDYLLRWRMVLAKDLLRGGGVSLAEVASAIGYQSASAFSTAFKRCIGQAPRTFARARPGPDVSVLGAGRSARRGFRRAATAGSPPRRGHRAAS
jgi:AraC-like DNA-binding protein